MWQSNHRKVDCYIKSRVKTKVVTIPPPPAPPEIKMAGRPATGRVNMAGEKEVESAARALKRQNAAVVHFSADMEVNSLKVASYLDSITGLACRRIDWRPRKLEQDGEWLVKFPHRDVLRRNLGGRWDAKKKRYGTVYEWEEGWEAVEDGGTPIRVWYRLFKVPSHYRCDAGVRRLFGGRGVVLITPLQIANDEYSQLPVEALVEVRSLKDVPGRLEAWCPRTGMHWVNVVEFAGLSQSQWPSWTEMPDESSEEEEAPAEESTMFIGWCDGPGPSELQWRAAELRDSTQNTN